MKKTTETIYNKTLKLFLLLSLAPILILGITFYYNAKKTIQQNIGHKLEELARLGMKRVQSRLLESKEHLENWAELDIMLDILTQDADGRIQAALDNFKISNPYYHRISCLNANGEIIASSEYELIGHVQAEEEYFKQAIAGKSYMSDIVRLENKNKIGINFSMPIRGIGTQNTVIGVLTAALNWKALYPLLDNIRIDQDSKEQTIDAHVMLIDNQGKVLFSPEFERKSLHNIFKQAGFAGNIPGMNLKSSSPADYIIQQDEHNQLSLIGYADFLKDDNLPEMDWTLLAVQNMEKAFAPVFEFRNFVIISGLFLVAIIILSAHFFSRQLSIPIKKLTSTAKHIAEEAANSDTEYIKEAAVPSSLAEINILADSFNQMSQILQKRNQTLKNNYEEVAFIINEIQRLLETAAKEKSFNVRFNNPNLVNCWEVLKCNKTDCPAYMNKDKHCWSIAGSYCTDKVKGVWAKIFGNCKKCRVYQKAIPNKYYLVGEIFNNMMNMLEHKNLQVKDYAQNLEQKVKDRTISLEKANQELKETQEQLIQTGKLAAIGQLAAGVSHELNNPLGGILGYSQFILEIGKEMNDKIPEELKSVFTYVEYIEKESQRCKTIVANLLRFSRSSEDDIAPLDVNRALEDTFTFTRHQLEINKVELVTSFAKNLPPVMGNEHRLQQVFTNLMINAQQAMAAGGKLTVSTAKNNGSVEIAFADTGCGIPKENMDKLFNPFFTTKSPGEGTGLGLSVTYGIIRDLGGEIEVDSKENKGATFKVKLPVGEVD